MDGRERLARLIADEMGENFDCLHQDKAHWTESRGLDCAGRFRDVNEPRRADYLCAADAILASDWLRDTLAAEREEGFQEGRKVRIRQVPRPPFDFDDCDTAAKGAGDGQ